MKYSETPCNIIGVRIGELEANFHSSTPILKVKFMLIDENGESYGAANFTSIWSEETRQAFFQFIECIEKDALAVLFKPPIEKKEPEQF